MNEENKNIEDLIPNNRIDEFLKELPREVPQEAREKIKKSIQLSISGSHQVVSGIVNRPHPFEKIMEPEHLTKIIDYSDKDSKRDFFLKLTVIISLLILIFMLKNQPDLLKNIIFALVGSAGGFGFGYQKGKSE
jgi:hypothetical protein